MQGGEKHLNQHGLASERADTLLSLLKGWLDAPGPDNGAFDAQIPMGR